ncbi:amidase [Haliscomenobacter hydrossis]|uniref:Amidase n=1 Tax=Haliscomenobacter hydrossis (strain ATCC 27775 / DSM 1100 / LMG 10767 / O) TaxID=760192 RepID=F4L3M0_HALH1|nr:amidase [Haliscomenobacter hydrossis]AEE53970.1 Amidase [Haliscomenobacter hydrossis DSM 1100]
MDRIRKSFRLFVLFAVIFILGAFTGRFFTDKITDTDVRGAAKIFGLEMTQSEIDSLLPGLEDARTAYLAHRKMTPSNDLGPALWFNPVLPGMNIPIGPDKVNFGKAPKVSMPKNRDELAWYTVRELAELIRSKQISSEELTRFFLDRLKKYDPQLHCVVTLTEELAIEQAKRADAEIKAGKYRGLLHGIPYGAKDLLAARKYKTTWGSVPFKDQVLDYDATVIQKLDAAGAVLCAKLTMGELAWGDVWFGEMTRNPWDTKTGSSGSSAGSASSVSAGLLPFAIGTETLGSIVSPSTVCGTTGLRPSYGRVSRHGAMALSWSMDKIGPICRSVEDCAIVFQAIQGPDPMDVSLIPAAFHYDANFDPRQLKIGYLKQDFARRYPFHDQDSVALQKMREMGFKLVPIELPSSPDLSIILSAESAAAFDELTLSGRDDLMRRQIKNAWPNSFREARFIPAVEYLQANRLRTKLMQEMQKVFQEVDVYINPSWGSRSLNITNHTGHPCVVIPNGFRNGRPTSLTFTGKLFEEGKILSLAKIYQEATEHHKQHPQL